MLRPVYTNQFKKDFKKAIRRGMKEEKLVNVISMLCRGETLPEANRDHKLVNSRNYRNVRECHIDLPDQGIGACLGTFQNGHSQRVVLR